MNYCGAMAGKRFLVGSIKSLALFHDLWIGNYNSGYSNGLEQLIFMALNLVGDL